QAAQALSPPSTNSQASLIVDKTHDTVEERRKRMRSLGIHVEGDNDDRTVYELPVVITKTRSRRRVHKLRWKEGSVDPDVR
ncbi:hypothetical protein PFISCL1PPCAC_21639, partial [Pristionchus fissidentatus]